MHAHHQGQREPPEGAIVGENVAIENPANEQYGNLIEELVGLLKAHPAYSGYSGKELREKAREIVIRRIN